MKNTFLVGLGLALATFVTPLAARELRPVPGSRVVIDVPPNYQPANRFAGFMTPDQTMSIVILDTPAVGYDQMASGMNAETLASRGFSKVEKRTLTGRAEPYVYLTAEQISPAGPLQKHILIIRNADHAAVITLSILKSNVDKPGATAAEIARMLISATLTATPAEVRSPFSFGYMGPFKDTGAQGPARLLTLDGVAAPATPEPARTLFLAAPSLQSADVGDLRTLADRIAVQVAGTREIAIAARKPVTIDGLDGIELVATGKTGDASTPVSLYQVFLKHPAGGYIRLVGQVATSSAATMFPEFEKIAQSFKLAR
jgi:hypothetical protein